MTPRPTRTAPAYDSGGRLPRVPNQPKTKAYAVRIDDERHARLLERAEAEGVNFSEIIRIAIDEYLSAPPRRPKPPRTK